MDALPPRLADAIVRRLGGDRRVRIDLDLRGHSPFEQDVWRKALEIPRGEVRPYGWVAAEIGRPRAVRAVGTALGHNPVPLIVPCHRVVRTDGLDRPVLARRSGQQADDPAQRGPGPRGPGGAGGGRHPLRRLRYDEHHVPAHVPARPARHGRASGGVPLGQGRRRGRLPSVQGLPAGLGSCAGGLRRLGPPVHAGPGRAHRADLDRATIREPCSSYAAHLDHLPMPTEPRRPPDRGTIWLGLLVLYVVWGSTYLGIAIAVETIPPFLMAAVRFAIAGTVLMTWSILRARRSFVAPSRREWRDTIIVGALLLGGGHGHGRVRRADDPVRHHGPAHRDDAGLGRDLRTRISSASDCRGSPASGSSSASSASRSSSGRRSSARRVPSTRSASRPSSCRRSPGRSVPSTPRTGRRSPASHSSRPAPRCSRAERSSP